MLVAQQQHQKVEIHRPISINLYRFSNSGEKTSLAYLVFIVRGIYNYEAFGLLTIVGIVPTILYLPAELEWN